MGFAFNASAVVASGAASTAKSTAGEHPVGYILTEAIDYIHVCPPNVYRELPLETLDYMINEEGLDPPSPPEPEPVDPEEKDPDDLIDRKKFPYRC